MNFPLKMKPTPPSSMTDDPRIHRIIHQHLHDVRNSINCLDLMAEMAADLCTDPALATPLAMMRADLTQLEATVNSLQFKFSEPQPSHVTAADLLQLWQNKIAPLENATHRIAWSPPTGSGVLTIDVDAILSVLRELVTAGWYRHAGCVLQAAVSTSETTVLAEVREPHPQTPPEADGMDEARRLVERNGGTLEVSEEPVSGDRVISMRFALVG